MLTTRHPLPKKAKRFLDNMSKYIDCKFYYYGSIQRWDYFPGQSDIDIDIFSENLQSTLNKMKIYLGVPDIKIKEVRYKLNGKLVSG